VSERHPGGVVEAEVLPGVDPAQPHLFSGGLKLVNDNRVTPGTASAGPRGVSAGRAL
jgi:hypothetical protein